jgi:hypothetical protein
MGFYSTFWRAWFIIYKVVEIVLARAEWILRLTIVEGYL